MKNQQTVSSSEYKNDFLYIIIRQDPDQGQRTYRYCCGRCAADREDPALKRSLLRRHRAIHDAAAHPSSQPFHPGSRSCTCIRDCGIYL